jgi:uncharacterized membrane protein affecting hemolysin expression
MMMIIIETIMNLLIQTRIIILLTGLIFSGLLSCDKDTEYLQVVAIPVSSDNYKAPCRTLLVVNACGIVILETTSPG